MAFRQTDSIPDTISTKDEPLSEGSANPNDLARERLALAEKRAELAEKRADVAEARADLAEKSGRSSTAPEGTHDTRPQREVDRTRSRQIDPTLDETQPARRDPSLRTDNQRSGTDRHDESETDTPKGKGRLLVLSILGVVVLIVIITLLRHRATTRAAQSDAAGGKGGANRAVPVSVAPIQQRDVPVFLDGLGNVNALNTVTVKTRIDGQLLRFNFQEGQLVHAGDEIALIDPAPSEAQLAQAEATKFKDEATLQNTRRDLERYAELYRAGVIPQQQLNTQQSQVVVNQGTIKADEAQIQQAKLNVAYCHIKSPLTGRIGIRNVDPGNMVHASDQNGVVVITQMQPIAVLFTLPEDQLPSVTRQMKHGLPIQAFSRDNSQKIADGMLLTIDNQIDPSTGTFRVKGLFPNTDAVLYPNQFVNARLQVDTKNGALTVPTAAVQHGSQGTYVYVVQPDSTVAMKPVTVAMTEGTMDVITGDIEANQRVVVDGADKLQPKAKVQVARGAEEGGSGGGATGAAGAHQGHRGGAGRPATGSQGSS